MNRKFYCFFGIALTVLLCGCQAARPTTAVTPPASSLTGTIAPSPTTTTPMAVPQATSSPTAASSPAPSPFPGEEAPTAEGFLLFNPGGEPGDGSVTTTPGTTQFEAQIVAAVTTHLAERLSVSETGVSLVGIRRQELPVAAPCGGTNLPERADAAPQGIVVGYEVVLEANGRHYRYVVAGARAYACPS